MSEEDNNFDDDFDDEEFDEEGEEEFGDEEEGAKLYPTPGFSQNWALVHQTLGPVFYLYMYLDQSLCINDCIGLKQ